ncbi:hypothetical protein BDV26DRAFT_296056 [Aspergillus bertholletiae]|uniref:Uncharacterized protein n=1 Tax=Aspergillus bertholletiae TaxID=1226010 RepID=A0A5N7AWY7_9EURO|nr:hypothetical protein BDV26DRAFT_296056 [Aspergillus bertholletiae]
MAAKLKNGKDIPYNEGFVCGAETSTSGRFVTHVLNPIARVAEKLGYENTLTGWTAAGKMLSWPPNTADPQKELKEKHSIPDYTLISLSQTETRAFEEAMYLWGTNLVLCI